MSLVKPEDFAKALNISYGTIRSKLSRGGLLRNKNKLIDTENPTNYIYILEINGGDQSVFEEYHKGVISKANISKKSLSPNDKSEKLKYNLKSTENEKIVKNEKPSKIKGSGSKLQAVDIKEKPVKKVPEKLTLEEKKEKEAQRKSNEILLSYELRKKEAEVKLAERNAELKQWELEKKAGNTLPLNMIEKVFEINFKSIYKSIKSQHKNIAMVMVQQLGGSKEDLDSILEQLDDILDGTVKSAERKSAVDTDKLIDEYSEIRSRGEKKV